jgi:hypothetical protein
MIRCTAQVLPLVADAEANVRQFATEAATTRAAEHRASRRRAGVTRERVVLQSFPEGSVVIAYVEAGDPDAVFAKFVASEVEYDVDFVTMVARSTGLDPEQASAAPPVELVYDIRPTVIHEEPLALFTVPLPSANAPAWREYNELVITTLGPEVLRSREALGWYEALFLQPGPGVDFVVCAPQGPNAANCLESVLRSRDPFIQEFMARISELHEIDFSAGPPPTSELIFAFDDRAR